MRGRGLARLLAIAVLTAGTLVLAAAASEASAAPSDAATAAPSLNVSAAILVAPNTGQELYGVNPQREVAIASATKLMTALVTLEHVHHLSTVFSAPNYYAAAVDSQIGLVPGERMSVHDLLLALLLPSADDAAEDLAYNIGHHSVSRFVAMMNAGARQLGLRHTHYSTPSGLDTPGNYSTAADLVKLASYDISHSAYFARVVALRSAILKSGNHVRYVVNRNTLVGEVPWIDGVKTGHTADAGYVLVASGHRHAMTLISAVLGTASEAERDANTLALLDYGFKNFHPVTPVVAGRVMARPTVRDRPGFKAAVIAGATFTRVLARHQRLRVALRMPAQLAGPLPRHARVGTAVVLADGRPIAQVPLRLASALPAVSGLTIAGRFITKPLMLVIIAIVLASLLAVVVAYRRRTGDTGDDLEAA